MQTLLSSRARLADPAAIELLVLHFSRHLGQRYARKVEHDRRVLSELDRMRIVPLVFGLLPRSAIFRPRYDVLIKPAIESHLRALGIPADPRLVEVLKSIADQYHRTSPSENRPQKMGIADLKALDRRLYSNILERQHRRCTYCGVLFDGNEEETLDHIVPWRLIGDVMDGSNWQIICRSCNTGKAMFLSTLQAVEAANWVYTEHRAQQPEVSLQTRFIVLVQKPMCSTSECGVGPSDAQLFVVPAHNDALPVPDHLTVLCERHR